MPATSEQALCFRGSFNGHGEAAAMESGKWNMEADGRQKELGEPVNRRRLER